MKKNPSGLIALLILLVTGTALAIDKKFGADRVYCEAPGSQSCTHRVYFEVDPSGMSMAEPCRGDNTPHLVLDGECVKAPPGIRFRESMDRPATERAPERAK